MNSLLFNIPATPISGIVLFFLGYLIYGILIESFFLDHTGSATNVMKTEMKFWPLILGNLSLAALLSYIFLKWAGITTFVGGLKTAATIGFSRVIKIQKKYIFKY